MLLRHVTHKPMIITKKGNVVRVTALINGEVQTQEYPEHTHVEALQDFMDKYSKVTDKA